MSCACVLECDSRSVGTESTDASLGEAKEEKGCAVVHEAAAEGDARRDRRVDVVSISGTAEGVRRSGFEERGGEVEMVCVGC